jgi:hypothetical protein
VEGGMGASVRLVPLWENSIQGGMIASLYNSRIVNEWERFFVLPIDNGSALENVPVNWWKVNPDGTWERSPSTVSPKTGPSSKEILSEYLKKNPKSPVPQSIPIMPIGAGNFVSGLLKLLTVAFEIAL